MFMYRLSHETKTIFSPDPTNSTFWLLQDAKKKPQTLQVCPFLKSTLFHVQIKSFTYKWQFCRVSITLALQDILPHDRYICPLPCIALVQNILQQSQVHEPSLMSQIHFKVSSCCVKPLSSATGHREGHRSSPVLERKHHLLIGVAGFF